MPYLKKLSSPLLAALGLLCLPALSQAQHTIFDGSSFSRHYGSTNMTSTFNASEGTVLLNGNPWDNISFGLSSSSVAPAVANNWQAPDAGILINYKVDGDPSSLYYVRLQYFDGSTNATLVAVEYPGGTPLVSDGTWNTFNVPVNDWTSTYYDKVTNSALNPDNPLQWRIQLQAGGGGFNDVSIGEISIIPEPGTYAAIFGVSFLGLALWIRRRRQA